VIGGAALDPEEAFVASIASCHMLWFLSLAASDGWCVDDYRDNAAGEMRKNANGKLFVSRVTLRPAVVFSGPSRPSRAPMPSPICTTGPMQSASSPTRC
jgi:organic hydroperoxide reductase OsmC/OhrA